MTIFRLACTCGAQFCYVYGARWKTCQCGQWDEDRLLDRAVGVVERNAGRRPLAGQERERAVQQAREHLRENHACTHMTWRRRAGQFRCEECRQTLPDYILECTRCAILACRRCRYNRL